MNDTIDNIPLPSNDHMVQLGVKNAETTISDYRDAFITNLETLEEVRWNQLYPYQLVVCKLENGVYFPTSTKFTLPMTPQELTIQTPFAISNTITAGGVAEEHNGVKVKNISFSGSLGSAPLRGSNKIYNVAPQGAEGFAKLVAGGTITAAKNLASSVVPRSSDGYIEDFKFPATPTLDATYKSTGYYQHLLLDKFLQGYAALKLRPENENYRLVFCIWKDDAQYLVTPISYTIKRSASSPGEYMYDLQLKAWKRIAMTGQMHAEFTVVKKKFTANDALKKLQQARNIIYKAKQTVQAVRGDADRLMGIVRETILAARDAVGVAKTVLDMPASIKSDYKILVEKQINGLKEDIKATGKAAEDWGKV